MPTLKEDVRQQMTAAMKSREAEKLQVLRQIWNAIRKKEIDDKVDLDDAGVEKVLLISKKQAQESLEQAKTANRPESIAELDAEILVISSFLPEQLTSDELKEIVTNVISDLKAAGNFPEGAKAMGLVIRGVREKAGSRAEGKAVQEAVKAQLS